MNVSHKKFVIASVIIMGLLLWLGLSLPLAAVLTFALVIIGYTAIGYFGDKKRLKWLVEKCDPQEFLRQTREQRSSLGKNPRIAAYISLNEAVGLMALGEFGRAKKVLLGIDKTKLNLKGRFLIIYTMNYILCLYELGNIQEAEGVFETQIPYLTPITKDTIFGMKLLVAERFFFLERYEESKSCYEDILKQKSNHYNYLNILYRLAQIEDKIGDPIAAKVKYTIVATEGNKLWISSQAKKLIL